MSGTVRARRLVCDLSRAARGARWGELPPDSVARAEKASAFLRDLDQPVGGPMVQVDELVKLDEEVFSDALEVLHGSENPAIRAAAESIDPDAFEKICGHVLGLRSPDPGVGGEFI